MLGSTLAIAIGLFSAHGILARPIKGIDRAVIQDEYDFVIAGGGHSHCITSESGANRLGVGGTAGLVVANRLSESGKFRVLVLEAGPDPNVVAAYKPLGGNSLITGTPMMCNKLD
jgi:uncharacterized membrane protein YgdD (TMEM256/DUF423 family)